MLGLNGEGWVEINNLPESENEKGKGKKGVLMQNSQQLAV